MGVCSRWRRIVLDTPRLWTRIFGAPPKIDFWIAQSKELPLNLELNLYVPGSHQILKALIPHAYRWEHVNLFLGPDSDSHSVLTPVRAHLCSLKSLKLLFGDTTGTVDFCEVAPQLTEINLVAVYNPVLIKLPWEQLRVCTADDSGVALYVLQHAKNLQTLHLDTTVDGNNPWLPLPRDPHSYHLRLNSLIMDGTPNVYLFFSSATLPSLRTLKVSFGDSEPGYDDSDEGGPGDRSKLISIMSAFLGRSSRHLSTVNLTGIPFPPDGLIECLAQIPSLVSLDIRFDDWHAIDDGLLDALNVDLSGYILPCLRFLSLRGPSVFFAECLNAFITSRQDIDPNDGVALLENLILECSVPEDQSTSQLPQFHHFASRGLNITYGKDWDIYNSIQADSFKPLWEMQT